MQLNRLIKQYQNLLVSVGIILLSFLGIVIGVIPLIQKSLVLWQDRGTLTEDVRLLQEKASLLESLNEETLRTELTALTTAVPADKSISTIFSTVDGLTNQSGLTPAEISLSNAGAIASGSAVGKKTTTERQFGGNVLPFSLVVSGGLDELIQFTKLSSAVRRLVRIRSIEVAFSTAQTLNAHVEMDTYYLPFPKTLGSVGQTIQAISSADQATIDAIGVLPIVVSDSFNASAAAAPQTFQEKTDPFSL